MNEELIKLAFQLGYAQGVEDLEKQAKDMSRGPGRWTDPRRDPPNPKRHQLPGTSHGNGAKPMKPAPAPAEESAGRKILNNLRAAGRKAMNSSAAQAIKRHKKLSAAAAALSLLTAGGGVYAAKRKGSED